MTIQELGQATITKYPQYQNMDPTQVGQLVVQKYPQYQSQITQPQQGNNFFQNLVDDPLKTLLVQPAVRAYQAGQALYGTVTGNDQLAGAGEKNVQLNIPLLGQMNIGAQKAGAAGAEQIGGDALKSAAYLAPGLGEGGVAAQVGKNALAGGAFGAGEAMQQGGSAGQVLTQGAEGAALGGAVGGASAVAGKALSALTKALPQKLYDSALKPTLDELQKSMKFDDFKTLNQQLIERGISGSPEKLLQLAQDGLQTNEDALQNVLQNTSGTISRDSLSKSLEPLVEKLANTPGMEEDFNQVAGVLSQFPKEVSITDANVIKRNLYSQLNDLAYKLDSNLSTKREAMKALASGIKTEIENAATGAPVKEINQNLALFGKLQDRTLRVLAQEARRSGMSLTDLITLGSSVASGHGMLGLVADVGKHVITKPSVKTKAAVLLNKAGSRTVPKILTTGIKKAIYSGAAQSSSK